MIVEDIGHDRRRHAMTKAFERDSRLPVAADSAGVAVGCAVSWYAVHHAFEMYGLAAFGRCGEEASALFSTVRWTIWLSALIAAGLAYIARIVRSKDGGNGWGFAVGMTKIMLVILLATRLSSAAGFAVGTFVPHSCDPIPLLGDWRVFQMVNIAGLLVLIPAGLLVAEYAQRKLLAARTCLGRGVVCAVLVTICLAGHCLSRLDWLGMILSEKAEAGEEEGETLPEESPFDNYRLTADEPGTVRT